MGIHRHQIYLRRLNPDGDTLGAVDALEVDDRTFRQFMIDLLVDGGVRASDELREGTIATVVVGDREAGELVGEVTAPATGSASSGTASTAQTTNTPPPASEPTQPTTS